MKVFPRLQIGMLLALVLILFSQESCRASLELGDRHGRRAVHHQSCK